MVPVSAGLANFPLSPIDSTAKPIKGPEPDKASEIPRKPRKEPTVKTNGVGLPGRKHELEPKEPSSDLKRPRVDDMEAPSPTKRAKMGATDDVVLIEDGDAGTGAITIDDD